MLLRSAASALPRFQSVILQQGSRLAPGSPRGHIVQSVPHIMRPDWSPTEVADNQRVEILATTQMSENQWWTSAYPAITPAQHFNHREIERPPHRCQEIFKPLRLLLVLSPLQDSHSSQSIEPLCENIRGDAQVLLHDVEPLHAKEALSQHQECPAVTDDLEGSRYGGWPAALIAVGIRRAPPLRYVRRGRSACPWPVAETDTNRGNRLAAGGTDADWMTRVAAGSMHQFERGYFALRQPVVAEPQKRQHHQIEILPFFGQAIFIPGGRIVVLLPEDDPVLGQSLEAIAERAARQAQRVLELVEPSRPEIHLPQHQEGPGIGDNRQGSLDRAIAD